MSQELINAITGFEKETALSITIKLLENNIEPEEILDHGRTAMQIIGDKFECGEYFLPELIISGDILASIADQLKPHLKGSTGGEKLGKVVFGTVSGDIHDIAKDIVVTMLDVNGFEVIDLGIDVPAERFVQAAQEHQAGIVGLSGFLTLAIGPMRDTVAAFKAAGMTDVKIMIGGGPVNELVCEDTGADAWGANAMDAVAIAKGWVGATS